MSKSSDFAWLDGKLVPWKDATMHISTECVLRGENVFEGERAYWSEQDQELYMFRHADHIRRLRQGARIMRMTIPYSDAEIETACIDLIRACRYRGSVHFRPVVYFAEGELTHYLPDEIRTGMFILAFSKPSIPALKTGVKSCVSTWQRNGDLSAPSRVKSGANYHNSRLAYIEARLNGFGPPVMLNNAGKVAEGPGSCIMMVRHGRLVTPPITADILESITRDTLIELAREELGLEVVERDVNRSELYVCDEAFFCGSGAEVLPIASIDHYDIGDGTPGSVTRRLQDLYFEVVSGRHAKYQHWLTPVYAGATAQASAAE
ncbi:branched-chain amino acid transaminase [Falsiroseomonas sp. HC035]|uniref:branched-chain amino acid transaminase n=1 Tax=Falsiroseomonas sp. HC035 TaxID=3390999 RepID=UPI003D311C4D